MSNARPLRLIVAGGGTGGHLFPALAIADRIRELASDRDVQIRMVGTRRGIEYRLRESLGYPLEIIPVWGLVRAFTWRNLVAPFVLVGALVKSFLLVRRFAPHGVIATGGYVCWPIARVAAWKGLPVFLQEQNSFPGIATRQLAPVAKRIYLGFDEARAHLKSGAPMLTTGNPVRAGLAGGDRAEAAHVFKLDISRKTILVLGGSQGARAINQAMLRSFRKLSRDFPYQILWQTGKRDYTEVVAQAGDTVTGHALFPFETRMALVYALADIAIVRAGAITLAELAACGIPALLIPYPHAAGDHQRKNAQAFAAREYGRVIDEKELESHDVLADAAAMLASGEADRMRQTMRSDRGATEPACDRIARDILNLLEQPATTERAA